MSIAEPPGEHAGLPLTSVTVFRGSRAACLEFGLVLEAKGVPYENAGAGGECELAVAPDDARAARDELTRYAAERTVPRPAPATFVPFAGATGAAGVYAFVLIAVAYCAGVQSFSVDWFGAGALESNAGAVRESWRAVTALTLHLDQEHLLGNLLFGSGIGILAGRMFGPGIAWLAILLAGAMANWVDMAVSPAGHRAVGASTAVFAALGLLAGFGWGERRNLRERLFFRWAPLLAGVCLLALLGGGNERVDVLGHLLGFCAGTALGLGFARARVPRTGAALQWSAGAVALAVLAFAWLTALRHAR